MTDLSIAALADKAAGEIIRRGWTQGILYDDDDVLVGYPYSTEIVAGRVYPHRELLADYPVCALGGAGAARYGNPAAGELPDGNGFDSLILAVARELDPSADSDVNIISGAMNRIVDFNDDDATTADDVIDLFRRVAAKHREAVVSK